MSKLIVMYPVWNDRDWIEACLEQLEYWKFDKLYFSEGCWDPKMPARSTDGTREYIEKYAKGKKNVWITDAIRDSDYRTNQCNQCTFVTRLSEAEHGDFFMYQASDFFLCKSDIDLYKQYMEKNIFDYPLFEIRNFWDSAILYYPKTTNQALNLPWRLIKRSYWKPTCHLWYKDKAYHESPHLRQSGRIPIVGYHYEGLRSPQRIKDKYGVGDRESPVTWKSGIKLKNRLTYKGKHPEFVREVLKKKGF